MVQRTELLAPKMRCSGEPGGSASLSPERRQSVAFIRRATLGSVFAGIAMSTLAPAFAQTDEIIVTAQKREESLNEVPISLTVLGPEQIADRGIEKIDDLGLVVPGFSYTESRVGTPIYTLRGVGFNDIALGGRPTVSIYHDEAPVPFTIETRGGFLDLERVEVLNGPQGTLFGNNATGGAINLIAAKPTDEFEAGLEFGYGNFSALTLAGHISGPISDTLRFRVAARHQQDDGFQESISTGDSNAAANLTSARALLEWTPTDRLAVNVNLNGFVDRSESQAPRLSGVLPLPPGFDALIPTFPGLQDIIDLQPGPENNRDVEFTEDDYARDNSFFQANVRADFDLTENLTLTSLSSYSTYDQDQTIDNDGSSLVFLQQRTIGEINSFSQELRLAGDLTDRLYVVVGGNIAIDEVFEDNFDDFTDSTTGIVLGVETADIISDQEVLTYAFFGNAEFKLTDTLTLQGGVRYTDHRNRFEGCTADAGDGIAGGVFGVGPGECFTLDLSTFMPGLVSIELNEDNVSWRAGLDWQATDGILLYANASRGFKQGGFPLLAALDSVQLQPTTQEQVTAYEGGVKATLSDTLQVNAAVYYYDYVDQQLLGFVNSPVFGSLLTLLNVPESEVFGLELQANWEPIEGLRINTATSYVDSEVTADFFTPDALQQPNNLNGEAIPNTPEWQFSGDVSYTWPVTTSMEAFIGAGLSYRSSTNAEFGEIPALAIDGYTLLDLRAGVQSQDGQWELSAYARNVTDEFYISNATISINTIAQYTGQPRRYGFTLRYNFGG